jgi:two-component system sensor kinase FixL
MSALSAGVPLIGWILDAPVLATFGASDYPIWPLTTIGHLGLAAGFAATVGRKWLALPLVALPLGIALIVAIEEIGAVSLGSDMLLFPQQIARVVAQYPGRPNGNSMLCFALLGAALLLVHRPRPIRVEAANLLASIALCVGFYSAVMVLWISASAAPFQFFVAPLPSSIATIALATAFLWWQHETGWLWLIGSGKLRQPLGWLLLPVVIVLPVLPFLLERWIDRSGATSALGASLFAVLANSAVVGIMLLFAADQLRRQRGALNDLTEALDSAAIALTYPNGDILHWSRGCEEFYGWPVSDAVGRNKHELLHSRSAAFSYSAALSLSADGERELIEQRRDGTEINVVERRRALQRPDGNSIIVLKMLDITERVRAETDLRASEQRLLLAAEANQVGVIDWDMTTGGLLWSPGSQQRLGLPPGSMADFDAWQAEVHPDDVAEIMASIDRASAEKLDRIAFQFRFLASDDGPRTIEGTSRCIYDENGVMVRVVSSLIDVTKRDARESELRLQSIIETVPDATIVIDARGTIRSFSRAAEAMFGFPARVTIGENVKMLMPDAIATGHDASIAQYFATGERKVIGKTRELTARRADGSYFPIELNVGEAKIGNEVIFTGIIRDVTDRLSSEKRLSDLNSELAHVSRQSAMSELAADLAHELNQPLSATANFLAAARMLIAQGETGERVAELLQMGEEQTLRSGEIIRRLRDFLTKREVEMRSESLSDVVRGAVDLVLFGVAQSDVSLTYDLDPKADAILVDRIQVQQVLVNLLRNSIEILRSLPAEHSKEIVIGSRPAPDGMVEIALSDNGPGIPAELTDFLYERFATTKKGSAMGIGLSISRRIVESHGGTIAAGNGPDGGAVFRFTLPAMEELNDDS